MGVQRAVDPTIPVAPLISSVRAHWQSPHRVTDRSACRTGAETQLRPGESILAEYGYQGSAVGR